MVVRSVGGRSTAATRAAARSFRAGAPDIPTFEKLYRRYRRDVFEFCARRIGDLGRAEELAQEAFLRAYLHRGEFVRGKAFWPWISTIARNLCTDELRARPRARLEPLDDLPEALGPSGPDHTAESAVRRVDAAALRRRLVGALRQLGPREREILWMRDAEGRSYDEIARAQGTTVNAARNVSWRARGTMRALLADLAHRIPGLAGLLGTAWSVRRGPERGKRAAIERLVRISQRMSPLAEPVVAALVGLALSLAGTGGPLQGSGVRGSLVAHPDTDPSGSGAVPEAGRAAQGVSRDRRDRFVGGNDLVRLTAEMDRRDGAALPHRSRLRVEVWGPNGLLFWTEVGAKCSPREEDLLPGKGPVRTDC